MKNRITRVDAPERAGAFSAEETTSLALIAAYASEPYAKKRIQKIIKSLDGKALAIGQDLVSRSAPERKASPKPLKTNVLAEKKRNKPSTVHEQRVQRLAKWGKKVG